jgi:predicted membrane channel-forming protein YqfA (hemolysin III family)
MPRAVHAFAWGGTLLAAIAVIIVAAAAEGTRPWEGWDEGRELRRPGYAERVWPDQPIRTRANTFSNLAYITVGLYACGLGLSDRRRAQGACPEAFPGNVVVATPALSILFGLSCLWLGLSSGLFHASLTRAGQRLDVAAMYPPLLSILAIAVARALPARIGRRFGAGLPTWSLLAAVVVVAEIALWKWKWRMSATTVLATLIAATAVVTVAEHLLRPGRFRSAWLGWGACLLTAGIVCRQTDVAGSFPVGPDSYLQGHALWHLLTAAALGTLYLHERSEHGRDG